MSHGERYTVRTMYGTFSLDEASYRDYLEGNLWICGPKKKPRPAAEPRPQVSERALKLRDLAERRGYAAIMAELCPGGSGPMPYVKRLAGADIGELNLTVRSSNGLRRGRVDNFGLLHELICSEGGVRSIRNIGATSEQEICQRFSEECYQRLESYEKAHFWQKVLDRTSAED